MVKIDKFLKISGLVFLLGLTSPNDLKSTNPAKSNDCIYKPSGEIVKNLDLDLDGKLETLLNESRYGVFAIEDDTGYIYSFNPDIQDSIEDYCISKEGKFYIINLMFKNGASNKLIFTGKDIYGLNPITPDKLIIQSPDAYEGEED